MTTTITKVSLEELITKRNAMIRFIGYLIDHHAAENLRFWLEAQIFKYERDQQKSKEEAERIYTRYWGGPNAIGLNVEEDHLVLELAHKVKRSDRTLFMLVQNAIWGLLKLECYPRFRAEEGVADKIKKSKLKILQKNEIAKELIDLLDKFLALNTQYPTMENGVFRATVLPNDAYQEHLHTSLPDIDELWKDPDLMLAFREYLYQQFAHENLSFYLEAANFEYLTDQKEIENRSNEIFDKFVGPNAKLPINLDFVVTQRLQKALQKPTNMSFKPVTEKIWKVLTNEWFPDFVVSPLYLACNDETIEFTKSDGGRKRSQTLDEYDLLCQNIGHSGPRKKGDAKNL